MSDELVQRLRGYARQGAWLSQLRDDAADAADEIERLRAEVEKCRALYALRMRERASEDVRLADTIARAERAESELAALRKRVATCRCSPRCLEE